MSPVQKIRSLDPLIAALETAEQGGPALDLRIAVALGPLGAEVVGRIKTLLDDGHGWELVSVLLDGEMPAFTRSLDARLPGEDIICTVYAAARRRWTAMHRTADGREVLGTAATEPLARRLAALRGIAATGGRGRAGSQQPDRQPPKAARGPAPEAPTTSEEEWKILF